MRVKLVETSTYHCSLEGCEDTINSEIERLEKRGCKIYSVNSSPERDIHLILTTIAYEIEDKKGENGSKEA